MSGALLSMVGCTNSDERLAVALVTPAPDASAARATALERIYVLTKNHDERGLLGPERASASPAPLDPAAVLGLFALDPKRYARDFVAAYPTTADALAFDYARAFAAAGVEPSGALFPVHALGALARTGDDAAYRKLISALPVTSGTLRDAYRSEVRRTIVQTSPGASIDAFATLPAGTELGAVASVDWCRQSPAALLAYRPTPAPVTPAASASPLAEVSPTSSKTSTSPAALSSPVALSSPAPTPHVAPTPTPPSLANVASLQAAIAHAAAVDCALARATVRPARHVNARAHTASPKKRA